MRIGDLARRGGVSTRALRYYEDSGILEAGRTAAGHREYEEAAVDRVRLIQQLYAAGLNSDAIRALLPAIAAHESSPQIVADLIERRDGLLRRIAELQDTVARLDDMIRIAETPAERCAVPEPASRASR